MATNRNPEPARPGRYWLPIVVIALLIAAAGPHAAAPQDDAHLAGPGEPWFVAPSTAPCIALREEPSDQGVLLTCLEPGSRLSASDLFAGWRKVATSAGEEGWVAVAYLESPIERQERLARPATDEPAASAVDPLDELLRERDDLTRRLTEAMSRIDALERQLLELTEASDSLSRALAQAEARQLFLQSDLEKTRAELVKLRGLPPDIVEPQPPPQPPPPPVAPDTEPAMEETAAPPAEEPLPAQPIANEDILGTVRAWANAWSEQRVDDYLAFYSPEFRPANGDSRDAWERKRRARVAAPESIAVTLDRLDVTASGDRAVVHFVQEYASDTFSDVVEKTLVLARTGGVWMIVEEVVGN